MEMVLLEPRCVAPNQKPYYTTSALIGLNFYSKTESTRWLWFVAQSSRKEVRDRGGATSWLGSSLIANSVARNFLTLMRKSVRLLKEVINLESLLLHENIRPIL